jgi:hypothetical protein
MHHLINFAHTPRAKALLPFMIFYVASQVFWIARLHQWKQKLVKNKALRIGLGVAGWVLYAVWYFYGVRNLRRVPSPTRLTIKDALLQAPFQLWIFGSVAGFAFYLVVSAWGGIWAWLGRVAAARS